MHESLIADARRVSAGLGITSTVLAVPSAVIGVGAAVGFLVLAVVAGVALIGGLTVARWVLLGLALAGLVVAVMFLGRVLVTWRASRQPDELATELVGLVDIEAITTAVLADLAELTAVEGGLRAVSRARALWRVLRRLDMQEHVSGFERAKWFVPPEVTRTWLFAQAVTWGGLGAWVLIPVVTAARFAGWV